MGVSPLSLCVVDGLKELEIVYHRIIRFNRRYVEVPPEILIMMSFSEVTGNGC